MSIDWQRVAEASLHPAQRSILEYLTEHSEGSPAAVAKAIGTDLGVAGVAYHFRCLAKRGLIEASRTVPVRGAVQHFYRLVP